MVDIIFFISQIRKLYISKLPKVTEKPDENLGCPTLVNAPLATKKSDVQWENGCPILCDIGSELGESKGHEIHLAQQPRAFLMLSELGTASQEGSQTSQPCQPAQGLRDRHRALGNPNSSLWVLQ